jgi:hypothetical protein
VLFEDPRISKKPFGISYRKGLLPRGFALSKVRKDRPVWDTYCVNEKKVAAVKKVMLPN